MIADIFPLFRTAKEDPTNGEEEGTQPNAAPPPLKVSDGTLPLGENCQQQIGGMVTE